MVLFYPRVSPPPRPPGRVSALLARFGNGTKVGRAARGVHQSVHLADSPPNL